MFFSYRSDTRIQRRRQHTNEFAGNEQLEPIIKSRIKPEGTEHRSSIGVKQNNASFYLY